MTPWQWWVLFVWSMSVLTTEVMIVVCLWLSCTLTKLMVSFFIAMRYPPILMADQSTELNFGVHPYFIDGSMRLPRSMTSVPLEHTLTSVKRVFRGNSMVCGCDDPPGTLPV
jgi:hypothetical protein